MEFMSQMTKDCYNAAYYAKKNISYSVNYMNYDAFTLQEYNKIIGDSVPGYQMEFECFNQSYPDLGKCEWDNLSDETRDFIKGRFADVSSDAFVSLSGHYAGKGAIVP